MKMLLQLRSSVSNLPRPSRILLGAACATFVLVSLLGSRHGHVPKEVVDLHFIKQSGGLYRIPNGPPPAVNLVVAAMAREDYSWVKDLKVPGMSIVPYIADNQSALYHPVQNKGHEAMVFLSYFWDFYDDLPDISILIHSSQRSWHVEELLDQSMIFSLNHLDLREVQRRGFVNLRVTWGIGCSSGSINTTRVFENSGVAEEREMREAFRANFNVYNVPEILATPCCSQIAVTKERIQSVPREQYQHHINWLLKTGLKDEISGRTWEHMWQYLFLQKAIDCPLEHKAYCRLYHICFGSYEAYDEWIELMQGKAKLEEEIKKLQVKDSEEKKKDEDAKNNQEEDKKDSKNGEEKVEKAKSEATKKATARTRKWLEDELESIKEAIRVRKDVAVVRGAVEANRIAEGENLYGDEIEPGLTREGIARQEEIERQG